MNGPSSSEAAAKQPVASGLDLRIVALAIAAIAIGIAFRDGIAKMLNDWESAEYSHGYLIPLVAIYMAIQSRERLKAMPAATGWWGPVVVAIAAALLVVGELSTLYSVSQYAFLLSIFGLILTVLGARKTARLWAPILFLVFMIPLPNFIYFNLSSSLQLISSAIGVAVIRLMGITVFLEGNIIDLGVYKLQVAEACSGLRYLFPLMSFGFLCGFLYQGAAWKRVILFLSSIPIAILMNSIRIGVIGVLVEYQGIEAAQGFLHLFEGWVVFIACLIILFFEALVLHKLTPNAGPLRDAFATDFSLSGLSSLRLPAMANPAPLYATTGILALAAIGSLFFSARSEIEPPRMSFSSFPLSFGDWRGREEALPPEVLDALKLDDYINVNFTDEKSNGYINFYTAYYASQRKGASAHSPRSCIPGGGWEIEDLRTVVVPGVGPGGGFTVNRVIIAKGESRQLVYYWFQQRGRIITNEYLVKWYLLVDALMRHRTDGAMVRLVTPVPQGADMAKAEAMLAGFMSEVVPGLGAYIPE